MKLKVKDVDIATGSTLVAILNEKDAQKMDLHFEDRIKIRTETCDIIAIIDIAESQRLVPEGSIGLMEEALECLGAVRDQEVKISLESLPDSVHYIKKKLKGQKLSEEEFNEIIKDVVENRLSRVEMTYFVSGCYLNGLTHNETVYLTKAMVKNGKQLELDAEKVVDKHCVGGVPGNRTTMVIVPIIAAAGMKIPKTSSRSITSPAGTADTMEVLADVSIEVDRMKQIVNETNGCIVWGGAFGLASADDKLIKLRHPLSLDPPGMVLASVLAKKHAVNATDVLIDIPCGKHAKIEKKRTAKKYKKKFEKIGKALGMRMKVLITDGSEPIGNGIGPALEARDVLWVLKQDEKAPKDLEQKSIMLAGSVIGSIKKAREILTSGEAYKKMCEIIKAQSGDPETKIVLGEQTFEVKSEKKGKVSHINNKIIAKIARVAGAPIDKGAGIYLEKHKGDNVETGELIYTVYAESAEKMEFAKTIIKEANGFEIS